MPGRGCFMNITKMRSRAGPKHLYVNYKRKTRTMDESCESAGEKGVLSESRKIKKAVSQQPSREIFLWALIHLNSSAQPLYIKIHYMREAEKEKRDILCPRVTFWSRGCCSYYNKLCRCSSRPRKETCRTHTLHLRAACVLGNKMNTYIYIESSISYSLFCFLNEAENKLWACRK